MTYVVTATQHRYGVVVSVEVEARHGDAAYCAAYELAPLVFGSCEEARERLTTVRIERKAGA